MAIGSTCEIETQLYLACDLEFIQNEELTPVADEVLQIRKMIIGYKKTLE